MFNRTLSIYLKKTTHLLYLRNNAGTDREPIINLQVLINLRISWPSGRNLKKDFWNLANVSTVVIWGIKKKVICGTFLSNLEVIISPFYFVCFPNSCTKHFWTFSLVRKSSLGDCDGLLNNGNDLCFDNLTIITSLNN